MKKNKLSPSGFSFQKYVSRKSSAADVREVNISDVVVENPDGIRYRHRVHAKVMNVMPRVYAIALFEK